jgi:hypothetical protein
MGGLGGNMGKAPETASAIDVELGLLVAAAVMEA